MRLLILTQKVALTDPMFGFFHQWIVKFSGRFDVVHVICLYEKEHSLPENVYVHSLGKEKHYGSDAESGIVSKILYTFTLYAHLLKINRRYDAVFVHMNQEYVLLAGILWRILGKKILFWRNHAKGSWLTDIAVFLSHRVFCTSPDSYTMRFKKTKRMPVGIDTSFFTPELSVLKIPKSILFLGRISPVKKVDLFLKAIDLIEKSSTPLSVTIAGGSLPRDSEYYDAVIREVQELDLEDKILFTGPVTQQEALRLYRKHEVYVNLTPSGSMDKTIFEALACGLKVVVANTFFKEKDIACWVLSDGEDVQKLANTLTEVLLYDLERNSALQKTTEAFVSYHNLDNLVEMVLAELT